MYDVKVLGADKSRKVIRCVDCRGWVDFDAGGVVTHSRRCDHAADRTCHPRGATTQDATAHEYECEQQRASGMSLQAASALLAAEGTVRGFGGSEDDIVDAVRLGYLSPDAAMNRDD